MFTYYFSASESTRVQTVNGDFETNVSYTIKASGNINQKAQTPLTDTINRRSQAIHHGIPDEQRLLNFLFKDQGYERTVRPVRNASTAVVIRMGLTLTQIFDMVRSSYALLNTPQDPDDVAAAVYSLHLLHNCKCVYNII